MFPSSWKKLGYWIWLIPLFAFFILAGIFVKSDYWMLILITFLLNSLYAIGLNLIMGCAGQFAVSNPAFAAIGAFGTAAMVLKFGWSFWPAVAVALILAAIVATFLGYIALRSAKGIFLGIITLSVVGLMQLVLKFPPLVPYTGGVNGLTTNFVVSFLGIELPSYRGLYFMMLIVVGLISWFVYRLTHSRTGRAFIALRENEPLALSMGIGPTYYKTLAFVFSSVIAALGGALYVPIFKFISEGQFTMEVAIMQVTMLIVGGIGSFLGPYLGAAIFLGVPELLRPIAEMRLAVFGLILIVVMFIMRGGVYGFLKNLFQTDLKPLPQGAVRASSEKGPPPETVSFQPSQTPARSSAKEKVVLKGDGVSRAFGGIMALRDVNFELRQGEILGLIGPNGAGKTTLFSLISGFDQPTHGRLLFRDENITGMAAEKIAEKGLVRTFQEVKVFPELTVLEHMMVSRHLKGRTGLYLDIIGGARLGVMEEENRQEAENLLRICNLEEQKNTIGKNLSYGEMKKLSIAMTLAVQPQVLLLDEPAAGLSTEETEAIAQVIQRINRQGVSIIIVEHNVPFITRIVSRLMVLDLGEKIADGPPQVVVTQDRVVNAYLGG
jgi:ABC-type branched-subunit amino acid transport system ATPase component/ABC-type branched-subunit amino acid transport system permease subunit